MDGHRYPAGRDQYRYPARRGRYHYRAGRDGYLFPAGRDRYRYPARRRWTAARAGSNDSRRRQQRTAATAGSGNSGRRQQQTASRKNPTSSPSDEAPGEHLCSCPMPTGAGSLETAAKRGKLAHPIPRRETSAQPFRRQQQRTAAADGDNRRQVHGPAHLRHQLLIPGRRAFIALRRFRNIARAAAAVLVHYSFEAGA